MPTSSFASASDNSLDNRTSNSFSGLVCGSPSGVTSSASLACAHAAFARWRETEALLAASHGGKGSAVTVLFTAAVLVVEHVPLMEGDPDLARHARIDLSA